MASVAAAVNKEISKPGSFNEQLKNSHVYPLKAGAVRILQLNIGKRCNLSCKHCHVNAGPRRQEIMSKPVLESCLRAAKYSPGITTIDMTGGSPEMNPQLDWFISKASKLGKRLIARTNLAILNEKEYSKFIDVYALNGVEICGSLPCYKSENVDEQRGKGVFDRCINVLQELNARGYGKKGSGLTLDLVYNPGGIFLPAPLKGLESDYKKNLKTQYGVIFNNLFCLINMPIGRFFNRLREVNRVSAYISELTATYNPETVPNVMCRNLVSVSWDGRLYDCDFNQALGFGVSCENSTAIDRFDASELDGREIVTHDRCYGCTAGNGSSCRGSII